MTGREHSIGHPSEGRVRTPWRVGTWLVAVVIAGALGGAVLRAVLAVAPDGPVVAVLEVGTTTGLYALLTAVTLLVARYVDRRRPARLGLGLGGPRFRRSLAVGLAIGVAMTTAVFLAELAGGLALVVDVLVLDPSAGVVPGATVEVAALAAVGPVAVLALQVPFYAAVGVAEEVLVRGYLLTNVAEGLAGLGPITERAAVAVAVLATGGLFGALHLANPGAGPLSAALISAVGVVLGWTYAVSGDLGIPIGIHVTWNLTLSALYGFPVSGLSPPASILDTVDTGDPILTGGAFGPEAGLVMALPLAVAVGGTAWWLRRSDGGWAIDPSIARYTHATADNHEG